MDFRSWLTFETFMEAAPANLPPNTVMCPKCKTRPMVYRGTGKYGPFWSCSGWRRDNPLCTGTMQPEAYAKAKKALETGKAEDDVYPDLAPQTDNRRMARKAPEPTKPLRTINPNGPMYFLARVVGNNDAGLDIGDYVAAARPTTKDTDPWSFITLDDEEREGTVPGANIAQILKGQRTPDGKPIKSQSIDDLIKAIPEDEKAKLVAKKESLKPIKGYNDEDTQKWSLRPNVEKCRLPDKNVNQHVKKIQDHFLNTNNDDPTDAKNLMIDALAGTGKTRTLRHLSSFIKPGEKWLYLVFNKKNQVESVSEFPAGVTVLTTHKFLGQLLEKNGAEVGGNTSLPEEKSKRISVVLDKMVHPLWPNDKLIYTGYGGVKTSRFHKRAKNVALKVAELAKNTAHDPNDERIEKQLADMIVKYGIDTDVSTEKTVQDRDYTPDIIEVAIDLMKATMIGALSRRENQYLRLGDLANVRDHDDTLWYAALNADKMDWTRPVKYNVVLMDEVQDFNKCQLIMARKLKETGARIIGVGDPNQAMYLFRGADTMAFKELKTIIGGGDGRLPINFRGDGNIIDWTNKNTHVNNLEYPEEKKGKGEVYADGGTHPPIGYHAFMDQLQREWQDAPEDAKKMKQGTCIVSRTNAPLAHSALQLLKAGIAFEIVGKDLSRNLVAYIKKATSYKENTVNIEYLASDLGDYFNSVSNKWGHLSAKQDELKEMEEFSTALSSILHYLAGKDYKEVPESSKMNTASDFIKWIEKKLGGIDENNDIEKMQAMKAKDPSTFVTLTTAHKCKGLQWSRVFLMKKSAYDRNNPKNVTEEQREQEDNAWYVAATRAENTLYVSSDEEPQ